MAELNPASTWYNVLLEIHKKKDKQTKMQRNNHCDVFILGIGMQLGLWQQQDQFTLSLTLSAVDVSYQL